MKLSHEAICQAYVELFQNLTPQRIREFEALVSANIHFRDPFNDVRGIAAMQAILDDMFQRCRNPHFDVLEYRLADDSGYIRWHFTAAVPVIGQLSVEGVSRIAFDAEGRVCEHLDYWDSAPIYLRLPLIGRLLRRVKAQMAAH